MAKFELAVAIEGPPEAEVLPPVAEVLPQAKYQMENVGMKNALGVAHFVGTIALAFFW